MDRIKSQNILKRLRYAGTRGYSELYTLILDLRRSRQHEQANELLTLVDTLLPIKMKPLTKSQRDFQALIKKIEGARDARMRMLIYRHHPSYGNRHNLELPPICGQCAVPRRS
jgi:hypothetical protein